VLSPLIIEYAGVPFFFAARVIQGACMVGVKQFIMSFAKLCSNFLLPWIMRPAQQCFMLSPVLPLLRRWTTAKEQGLLVGLAFAGAALANAATYPMAGLMCKYSGWRSIFYFAGKSIRLVARLVAFI
jgi:ACS family sodium-dependent inorganic phosphate cotransporter-like MFS transporter 5